MNSDTPNPISDEALFGNKLKTDPDSPVGALIANLGVADQIHLRNRRKALSKITDPEILRAMVFSLEIENRGQLGLMRSGLTGIERSVRQAIQGYGDGD